MEVKVALLFIFLNNYSKAKSGLIFKKQTIFLIEKNHVCYVYLLKNANNGLTQPN